MGGKMKNNSFKALIISINGGKKGAYSYVSSYAEAGFTEAIQHFNAALAKDPAYAPAHAGLADCYTLLAWYGHRPSLEALTTAKMHASSALELDNTLADAYTSRAFARMMHDWEWTEAQRDFPPARSPCPDRESATSCGPTRRSSRRTSRPKARPGRAATGACPRSPRRRDLRNRGSRPPAGRRSPASNWPGWP